MHAYYGGMALDEMLHVAVVNISTDVQYRCRDSKIAGFFSMKCQRTKNVSVWQNKAHIKFQSITDRQQKFKDCSSP